MALLFNVTFTSSDVRRLAAFWAGALDMTVVEERSGLVRLAPAAPGAPHLLLLHSDTPAPSAGRVHLDLAAADVPAEVARLVALGARLADGATPEATVAREANGLEWFVLHDPDGNELCLGGLPEPATS